MVRTEKRRDVASTGRHFARGVDLVGDHVGRCAAVYLEPDTAAARCVFRSNVRADDDGSHALVSESIRWRTQGSAVAHHESACAGKNVYVLRDSGTGAGWRNGA